MSSTTGFTTGGFYKRTPLQIETDYQDSASGVFEEINFSPGDVLYQISKVIKLREYHNELNIEAIVSGLSVQTAYGIFLDKLGENKGIFRKGKQKAGGYVHLTFTPPDAGATYNLSGTQYLTKTNLTFVRTTNGYETIQRYIPFTRGAGTIDPIPYPYVWLTGIGYINNESDGSGATDYTPTWNQTMQYFNWSGVGGGTTGMTYYVEVTGQMRYKEDVGAETAGSGYNVGANTITSWTNNATLPSNTTVNNPYSLTGGASYESDDDYRERILRAVNRTFTLKNIRDIAYGINGVRAAHVYQALGTDINTVSGAWKTETPSITGGYISITGTYSGGYNDISGAMYSQRWTPTQGIIGLKQTILRGARIGFPPPLVLGLREQDEDSYLASGTFDTFDVSPPAASGQDLDIDIKYLDLDHTVEYRFDLWCNDQTGASGAGYWGSNYWKIYTTSGLDMSGNMGSDITGYLYAPDGTVDSSGNLIMKTKYGTAAFKIDLAVKDGYSYDEIENTLDEKLDWVDGSGYAPVGVDYSINEATKVPIYYTCTIYINDNVGASLSTIKDRIDNKVEAYVEGLEPGENVVYSEIYKIIMNDKDIWRIGDFKIYESGGSHLEDEDIHIDDDEVSIFQSSTVNRG